MDAMTHSSAYPEGGSGSGRAGDAGARSQQEPDGQGWGWFSKSSPPAADPDSDSGDAGRSAGRPGEPPARPPTAIRPVGSGADRSRAAHAGHREPDPGPGAVSAGYGREPAGHPDGAGEDLFGTRRPARARDGHDPSGREPAGYDPSAYDPSAYDPSAYETSGYRTSGYDEPGYDEPGYDTSRYGGPTRPHARPVFPDDAGRDAAPDRWRERPAESRWSGLTEPAAHPAPDTGGRYARDGAAPAAGGWFGSAPRPTDTGYARPGGAPAARDRYQPPAEPAVPTGPTGTAAFGSEEDASPDTVLIRRTMRLVEPVADKATSYFYALLFLRHPELRELFPAAMDTQRDRLFRALLTAAKHADDAETLTDYLAHLGRGHRKYGTRAEHYPAVGECLIGALTRYASAIWNDEVEAAWVRAYTAISQTMIDAAAEDERVAPPWWQAEVVSHERRTSDIAVITVRPDQPYPFLAGQYASLETPWWPRVWRHYSFASAPRSDGLLAFHVRAVPAGWVSSAIVNRARPGDVIRLGPPAGSMTVDHATDNGLLCLGGGTGIAPIKALVEDVAEHGRRRPVDVFYAARRDHDLYDLDTMLGMQERHPWLSVRPVVSDSPVRDAGLEAGRLTDVVTRYGPWPSYDAYLSGPPGMIRSSVDALVGIGMPTDRIRHDSLEELVLARD